MNVICKVRYKDIDAKTIEALGKECPIIYAVCDAEHEQVIFCMPSLYFHLLDKFEEISKNKDEKNVPV